MMRRYHKLHTFSLGIHHIVEYQVFYHHRTETEYYLSNLSSPNSDSV